MTTRPDYMLESNRAQPELEEDKPVDALPVNNRAHLFRVSASQRRKLVRCWGISWALGIGSLVTTGFSAPEQIGDENRAWEIDSEGLFSSDVDIFSTTLNYSQDNDRNNWSVIAIQSLLNIAYEPFATADIIGFARELTESNTALQFAVTKSPSPFLKFQISAGGYHGFSDHSSRWLDEYYQQQFSAFAGYKQANPWGYNAGINIQWETTSLFGIVGAAATFQQDDVAPGYDRPLFQALERGRERLLTGAITLSSEQIVTRRARVRHEVQVTSTTDREVRIGYRGNLNLALGEYWVARAEAAFTYEESSFASQPDFEAHSFGLNLERDWDERWFLGVHARTYEDNGQIETSILVSSGPPPLTTDQFGVSLRWQHERWSSKLSASSYRTRFDEVASDIRPFGNLYRDRNWVLIESTLRLQF